MPKVKTKRAAAKRFKVTGTGKLKRMKAYKSHILTKKTTKRKKGSGIKGERIFGGKKYSLQKKNILPHQKRKFNISGT